MLALTPAAIDTLGEVGRPVFAPAGFVENVELMVFERPFHRRADRAGRIFGRRVGNVGDAVGIDQVVRPEGYSEVARLLTFFFRRERQLFDRHDRGLAGALHAHVAGVARDDAAEDIDDVDGDKAAFGVHIQDPSAAPSLVERFGINGFGLIVGETSFEQHHGDAVGIVNFGFADRNRNAGFIRYDLSIGISLVFLADNCRHLGCLDDRWRNHRRLYLFNFWLRQYLRRFDGRLHRENRNIFLGPVQDPAVRSPAQRIEAGVVKRQIQRGQSSYSGRRDIPVVIGISPAARTILVPHIPYAGAERVTQRILSGSNLHACLVQQKKVSVRAAYFFCAGRIMRQKKIGRTLHSSQPLIGSHGRKLWIFLVEYAGIAIIKNMDAFAGLRTRENFFARGRVNHAPTGHVACRFPHLHAGAFAELAVDQLRTQGRNSP